MIELDKVQEILAEYGLKPTATPRPPAILGRGNSSIVDTSLGRKMLKRYKASVALPAVIHEHSILTYLAQINFPAPRLLSTCTGETFVHRQGDTYALFDFIEGYIQYPNYFLPPAQVRRFVSAAGETLASLHDELQDFVPAGQNPNGFKSLRGDRWRDLGWYTDKLAHCIAETRRLNTTGNETPAIVNILLRRADWIHDTLCQLDRVLKAAAPPRLIIHGDYGPCNLLFKQNAPAVVLDFEIARLDWPIVDLAKAISNFAFDRLGFSFGKMKRFLDAYEARFPISNDELRLIPTVWQFLLIRRVIVCWYNYCMTRANRWWTEIQHHLKRMDWIVDNREKLLAHLVTIHEPS